MGKSILDGGMSCGVFIFEHKVRADVFVDRRCPFQVWMLSIVDQLSDGSCGKCFRGTAGEPLSISGCILVWQDCISVALSRSA